ncbi:hypothetical protein [Lentibacillus amyloliquefaciens]|uniref:hypothetical protein n=1 Tax=Lentibacillus amyloliquefaciens TaxID=1472767 RepID=UPI001F2362FE|nr:hypothetical protein [Lentibacillus amyloliquefaciens]
MMEQLSRFMDMIHYQSGYSMKYSIAVFLVTQTTTALFYEWITRQQRRTGVSDDVVKSDNGSV